jgi:light-regulated signal transduction histidine kinase (bacteriophytochrome)
MEISKTQRQYVLWFRPEILQTVLGQVIPEQAELGGKREAKAS